MSHRAKCVPKYNIYFKNIYIKFPAIVLLDSFRFLSDVSTSFLKSVINPSSFQSISLSFLFFRPIQFPHFNFLSFHALTLCSCTICCSLIFSSLKACAKPSGQEIVTCCRSVKPGGVIGKERTPPPGNEKREI